MLLLRQILSPLSPPELLHHLRSSRSGQRRKPITTVYSSRDAAEKESEEEYQVDPDKAREALRKLDEQLQSLSSTKQTPHPPKIKAAAAPYQEDIDRDKFKMRIQPPLLNESFLSYTTFVLLAFTIFYNFLFATVIKPSIDIPDQPQLEEEEEVNKYENPAPTRLDIIDLVMPSS
ncbi:uncharacterized protein LOC124925394 isoform X2 [Impatiens glandulifera]|uniref:uncharacterized protein LOC124925394 isoform X2 n=1 Tax=Impatiens glandulifera TaxID=253017 RepID=UPI001FB145F2|nr:uncharacterized protein LOC124925394 isoform X2 [Impatiens glandulifera]